MPRYPNYPSQPFTGNLPGLVAMGPADLRASSSTAPYYQARIDRMYGRNLAGLGGQQVEVQDEAAEPAWADNELKLLKELDDVTGDGVFDPPGTKPNFYRDAGVFAGRWGAPGYIERERSFHLSEIVDATTGRPVVYVPSGAVSMDSAAQVAYIENGRYPAPVPVLNSQEGRQLPRRSTVNVMQNPEPVTSASGTGALPFGLSWNAAAAIAGALGLAAGVTIALARRK